MDVGGGGVMEIGGGGRAMLVPEPRILDVLRVASRCWAAKEAIISLILEKLFRISPNRAQLFASNAAKFRRILSRKALVCSSVVNYILCNGNPFGHLQHHMSMVVDGGFQVCVVLGPGIFSGIGVIHGGGGWCGGC